MAEKLASLLSVVDRSTPLLATAFAAVAALANVWTVWRARRETQTEIFFFFRERYTAPEMDQALGALWEWRVRHGEQFLDDWVSEMERKSDDGLRIGRARRHVSRYFIDVARLYRVGYISKRLARIVTANNGFNILIDMCEPMSKCEDTHYSSEYARVLRSIRRKYRSGDLD